MWDKVSWLSSFDMGTCWILQINRAIKGGTFFESLPMTYIDMQTLHQLPLLTSCGTGRGKIFGSVCVCVCVGLRSAGWTVGPTDLKFSTHIKDNHISNDGEGQGYRSKVTKVTNVKKIQFSAQYQKRWSEVKDTRVGVTKSVQRSRSKLDGEFSTPSTRRRCTTRVFLLN